MKRDSKNLRLIKGTTTKSATNLKVIADQTQSLDEKWQSVEGVPLRTSKKQNSNDNDEGPGAA